jgi:hypothetical protein
MMAAGSVLAGLALEPSRPSTRAAAGYLVERESDMSITAFTYDDQADFFSRGSTYGILSYPALAQSPTYKPCRFGSLKVLAAEL